MTRRRKDLKRAGTARKRSGIRRGERREFVHDPRPYDERRLARH